MKKVLCLCLSLILCFGLISCGNNNNNSRMRTEETTFDARVRELTPQIGFSTVAEDNNFKNGDERIIKGEKDDSALSGLKKLEQVTLKDKNSNSTLSKKKLSHSHGPASGGQAHYTVVGFQKTFDKYGTLTLDTKSEEKVIYLTFDCGYEHDNLTSKVLDTLKEKEVPAVFFCTLDFLKSETETVGRMIKENHIVGNHSSTHPSFPTLSREEMKTEIERTENYLRENFGYAARYFRFPAGEYSEDALDLVNSIGYMSVFWSAAYDDWDTSKVRGKDYTIEKVMSRLHPGAVLLLHSVSKDNADALPELIDKIRAEGYTFKALSDYKG